MCRLADKTISEILSRGHIYEVGGAVRDHFLALKRPVKDRDYLVTGIPYDELTALLGDHGRVDLVGKSFGVIKFTRFAGEQSFTFDITLPRKEHSTGSGHKDFAVEFDAGLGVKDDLARRDFTINAMAIDLETKEIIDPLGGRADLERRQLKMTSRASFEEDPLRMLRAVQFAARFDLSIEPETLASISDHASKIATVSAERVAEELAKLLQLAEKPSIGFYLMRTTGLLKEILPELEQTVGVEQPGGFHKYDVFEHTLRCIDACRADNLRLRLAALFHDINKPQAKRLTDTGATFYSHEIGGAETARQVLGLLRFSRELTEETALLVERHMFTTDVTDKGLRRLIRRVGVDLIFDLLDLRRADVIAQGMGGTTEDVDLFEQNIREEILRKPPFKYSDLALDGRDIMKLFGLSPSPQVGQILEHLMEKVLDNPGDNTQEVLESFATKYYQTEMENNAGHSKGNRQ